MRWVRKDGEVRVWYTVEEVGTVLAQVPPGSGKKAQAQAQAQAGKREGGEGREGELASQRAKSWHTHTHTAPQITADLHYSHSSMVSVSTVQQQDNTPIQYSTHTPVQHS